MLKKLLQTTGLVGTLAVGAGAFISPAMAQTVDVTVTLQDENGAAIDDFRWLLEEDNTTLHDPESTHGNVVGTDHANTLSVQFHKSYAPVVGHGCVGDLSQADSLDAADGISCSSTITIPDTGRYFLSVLPYDGHRLTGVAINADEISGAASYTLTAAGTLNADTGLIEVPSAQMTILAFEDIAPLNNAPDALNQVGGERGLEGFAILIEDAGGKYGASGGQLVADVYGNALGTTYVEDEFGVMQYDTEGSPIVDVMGTGELLTGPDGFITIKHVAPAKYGIKLVPPSAPENEYHDYIQTTTIEGTPTIDAWLKPNEGPLLVEFGAAQPFHVFAGFVPPTPLTQGPGTGTPATVTGTVHAMRMARTPNIALNFGAPWNEYNGASPCWVGVNDLSDGGAMIMAQECGADSTFSIDGINPGTYQLVVWDKFLDGIIAFSTFVVDQNGNCSTTGVDATLDQCALGEVGMFPWFARIDNWVYFDSNNNGVMDDGEPGIPEQAVNLRFRDGTIFQSFPTDLTGYVPFDQVFPFFHWLVAEVDFARFKATTVTTYVDDGYLLGDNESVLDTSDPLNVRYSDILNPQVDPNTGLGYRIDADSVLTQAYSAFAGSVSVLEWGKQNYGNTESGGISGIVYYAVTRAEDDPQFAAAEPWEPGVPRVQMALYAPCGDPGTLASNQNNGRDEACDSYEDPENPGTYITGTRAKVRLNASGTVNPNRIFQEPDVDNYPFNAQYCVNANARDNPDASGCAFGPEDIDNNGNGLFDAGDAMSIVWTDSWDDSLPEECPPSQLQVAAGTADGTQAPFRAHNGDASLEQDPATSCFDGLRPFNQFQPGVFDGGFAIEEYTPTGASRNALGGSTPLVNGDYIVQAITPPHLKPLTSQARNVDFGETFGQNEIGLNALPFDCAGWNYIVPADLTLFPGVEAPLGGTVQAMCDMKAATLRTGFSGGGQNAGAEFWVYSDVPKAARMVGNVFDDLTNASDTRNPNFGEKYAPPFLPVAIKDYEGTEITRVYTDEFGAFNALLPSTFSTNLPSQSGMGPNMLQACLNDPIKPDGSFDPAFKRGYSQVCYTLQYMPGSTTYLDTPVLPLAAFAARESFPLDCECRDGTPVIYSVDNGGAYGGAVAENATDTFTVISQGATLVPNPDYDQVDQPKLIERDYGFGDAVGQIFIGGVEQTAASWSNDTITFTRDPASPADGDLIIIRGDNGEQTDVGVEIVLANGAPVMTVASGESIQTAIDAAADGTIISIAPGRYDESLILTKNLRLKGSGAPSTVINGKLADASAVLTWQSDIDGRVTDGDIGLLPEQVVANIYEVLLTEVGAPLSVFGRSSIDTTDAAGADGLTFTSGSNGGGVFVNAYVTNFTLSNNVMAYNQGDYGGGVRVGVPGPSVDPTNDGFTLRNSRIIQNGGGTDAGTEGPGGVALYAGADGYLVKENYICGNFSLDNGGGIGHIGESDEGQIVDNKVLFNQSFNQQQQANGGGIYVSGQSNTGVTTDAGAGDVRIERNIIQGNQAGAGNGGGIAVTNYNGSDAIPGDGLDTYLLRVYNNTIVNNVTGLAGALSFGDVERANIYHNTIAYNQSTATAEAAFSGPNGFSESVPQVSGIYAQRHSENLLTVLGQTTGFSNPEFLDNIVWHNASCYWTDGGALGDQTIVCNDDTDPTSFMEFGVEAAVGNDCVNIDYSLLTDVADDAICTSSTNETAAATAELFVGPSYLTSLSLDPFAGTAGLVSAFAAVDEGGNFITVNYGVDTVLDPGGQLTPKGDFHILASSAAVDIGTGTGIATDIDGDDRQIGAAPDAGSDEVVVVNTNTITSVSATIETISASRIRILVMAQSSNGADANLTVTITDGSGDAVVEDIPLSFRSGTGVWQRYVSVRTNRNEAPYEVTVQGAEGSVTVTAN